MLAVNLQTGQARTHSSRSCHFCLTKQIPIGSTKNGVGSVQSLFPSLLARVELLDGLQKDTEAVIGQPLPTTSDPQNQCWQGKQAL